MRLPSAQDYVAQVAKEHQWLPRFATDLARFLIALQGIDPTGEPLPRLHDFQRGGPLTTYGRETYQAIATLDGKIDTGAATEVWEAAIAAAWRGSPVWIHGDLTTGNLLVERGWLSAVIDFGTCGVGDPACDLTIAWTLLDARSRATFRAALPLDVASWARGRGWALWNGLITLVDHQDTDPVHANWARRIIDAALADHAQTAN